MSVYPPRRRMKTRECRASTASPTDKIIQQSLPMLDGHNRSDGHRKMSNSLNGLLREPSRRRQTSLFTP